MNLKIGIVGTNFISDWLCMSIARVDGVEINSVYSRSQEKAKSFIYKNSLQAAAFSDYEKFLDSDIDAVYIATPTYIHCQQALTAMNHGKHVLCEKIIASNIQELREMVSCAKENKVVLMEAMRAAFDPLYDKVRELLKEIGEIRYISFEFCQYSSRYDKFKEGEILNAFRPELSNAAIMDIGIYPVYLLMDLFGKPQSIKAFCTKLSNDFEGSGMISMKYPDMIAQVLYSKISDSVNPSIIQGEKGSILIDDIASPKEIKLCLRKQNSISFTKNKDLGKVLDRPDFEEYIRRAENMRYEVIYFDKLIEENRIEHRHLQNSINAMEVIDEARKQNDVRFPSDK